MKKYIGIYTDASLKEVKSAFNAVVFSLFATELALLPTEHDEFWNYKTFVVWSFDFIEDTGITYDEFLKWCLPMLSYKLDTLFHAGICEFYHLEACNSPQSQEEENYHDSIICS